MPSAFATGLTLRECFRPTRHQGAVYPLSHGEAVPIDGCSIEPLDGLLCCLVGINIDQPMELNTTGIHVENTHQLAFGDRAPASEGHEPLGFYRALNDGEKILPRNRSGDMGY